MKKLLLVPVLLAATLIPTTQAQAADIGQRICEYVQANDKGRLRSFLKQNKLKLRSIYDDLKCNGDNLLIFASLYSTKLLITTHTTRYKKWVFHCFFTILQFITF